MERRRVWAGATIFWWMLALPAGAAVEPTVVRQELERIEDLRFLHRMALQDLHDAKALAVYLQGWKGPDRSREVEDRFSEAEGLYGSLRGIDHGATALQAQLDVAGVEPPSTAQFDLVQRARAVVAREVNDFCGRCQAFKSDLTAQVIATARTNTTWEIVSQAESWTDSAREEGRKAGLHYGWNATEKFFQWPEADRDYLLTKGRKIGITFLNLSWAPLSNWGDIERAPGQYDWSALDSALGQLGRHELTAALMLHTLTGSPPVWWIEKAGADCQFTVNLKDREGERKVQSGINLFHPATGEAFAKFLSAYAAHLRGKWPGRVDGVYVEGNQREIEAVADESPAMGAYWRRWSRSDTAWRTPETLRGAEQPDEAAVGRAEMCREQWLLDYVRSMREALQKGWAELPVQNPTLSDDFHRMHGAVVGKSRDLFALAQLADNPGSATDSPPSFTLLRDAAGDRWLWQLGIHTGCGTTASAASAQPLFYGATRLVQGGPGWGMRAHFPGAWFRYCDWQIGDFGIGSYALSPRRSHEMSPVFLNTSAPITDLAVLWSQSTLRRDPRRDVWRDTLAFGHLLRRSFFQFDYLPETGLAQRLKNYRVLILSNTQSLPDETCRIIRDWVEQGGILLGFGAPALFDQFGQRRATSPLAEVFGADIVRMRVPAPVRPDNLYTGHPEGAFLSPPPQAWQYEANMTAALKPLTGKARAWFAGVEEDVAIVENTFGKGAALWCGYPVGFLYRESAPYEFAYGLSHHRTLSYNAEQNHYEQWIVTELEKRGIVRDVTVPSGQFLRGQLRDDGDWLHIFSNSPKYHEYLLENDAPARTVAAVTRRREGINNIYVGLLNTEGNYFWQRGYFRSTLPGGQIVVSVALREAGKDKSQRPVVLDARLRVPVPATLKRDRIEFSTWLPAAQSSAFVVAPDGVVRLFGDPAVPGDGPSEIAQRTAGFEAGKGLAEVEVLDPDRIAAFLRSRKGKAVVIGYGDRRFRPAAETLAQWLQKARGITADLTETGRRAIIRKAYMDGFGYNQPLPEPVTADILIGNCQDNPLMWRFLMLHGECSWLPLEVNQDFPGLGHAFVMLSAPIVTQSNGEPGGKAAERQLVIGASFPSEALQAVKALQRIRR